MRGPAARRVAARAWLLVVAFLAAACGSSGVPPIGAGGRPFEPDADELQLWAQAESEEAQLQQRVKLYDDPPLREYLARIGDALLPDQVRAAGGPAFTFDVLRDPTLNAFAMPNGRIYIHTGLLARLDNEAQLAMIVAHEMAHVTNRHALRVGRDGRGRPALASASLNGVEMAARSRARSVDDSGDAILSPAAGIVFGLGLPLVTIAAVDGHGRDLERDADAHGMASLVRAGYDPKEAPRAFERLRSEHRDRGSLEAFLFGSQRTLAERVETTSRLLETTYASAAAAPDTVKNSDEFGVRMRTVVRENARLDLQAGRFKLAEAQLDRVLAITPRDPVAHLYYGDLYRLQSQRARNAADRADKVRKAFERYARATELDPAYAEPFRQLGFLHYQQQDTERAKAAFRQYLALAPDAPDARRIEAYLIELDH